MSFIGFLINIIKLSYTIVIKKKENAEKRKKNHIFK